MGHPLPRVTARQIMRVLEQCGFRRVRQTGSHIIFRNQANKRTTVPFHGSKILHPKLLKSILREAKITVAQLRKLL